VKPPCLGRLRAVPRHCVSYPGIHLTTEKKKHGKPSVRVVQIQLDKIQYVDMATMVNMTSLLISVSLGTLKENWVRTRLAQISTELPK